MRGEGDHQSPAHFGWCDALRGGVDHTRGHRGTRRVTRWFTHTGQQVSQNFGIETVSRDEARNLVSEISHCG